MTDTNTVKIPDIGGAEGVDVIEVMIKEGDVIEADDSLITLESDKASMEIPSPAAGKVTKVLIKVGDKVSEGDPIVEMSGSGDDSDQSSKKEDSESSAAESTEQESEKTAEKSQPEEEEGEKEEKEDEKEAEKEEKETETEKAEKEPEKTPRSAPSTDTHAGDEKNVHAGPAVRRMAHELAVDLKQVKGSGRKNRITKEDVTAFIKKKMQQPPAGTAGIALPTTQPVDFSRFGEIEVRELGKIKRLTGESVHRSWVGIPHVTQFEDADITELEAFRKSEQEQAKKDGYKLTLLAFVCKALCQALKAYPQFNSSLDPNGDKLIYKKYFNIGIAVDTPNGLVVPVIKGVDKLSVADIAREMGRLSSKAREKGLMPNDMNGGCITISSLGGIGGTAFTPIVNGPEVAILGLSRSILKPVWQKDQFVPRLMLPLSLSYDHRVIDGAEAARFTSYLAQLLADIRRVLL